MWESHYLFSNINFNSVSALKMTILLLSSLKKLIIFFTIKPSLGINNNIILRINISMSKNTESIDVTKFLQPFYTINNPNICSDSLYQLTRKCLFRINRIFGDLVTFQYYFSFAKKYSELKSNTPRGFSPLPKVLECKFFSLNMNLCFMRKMS